MVDSVEPAPTQQQQESTTRFEVAPPTPPVSTEIPSESRTDAAAAFAPPPPPAPRTAVFVAHGMGQQITFQTLDDVAEGLLRHDPRWDPADPHKLPKQTIQTVQIEQQRLQRVELSLQDAAGCEHIVHVYEGYWAPLTEGEVTLRDVIRFLFRAGGNGILNGMRPFRRWLFRGYPEFPAAIRTVLYLLIALGVVASLVVANSTILLVAAARSPLEDPPGWLSDALFSDLTTTFNVLLTFMAAFGISLAVAKLLRKARVWPFLHSIWTFVTFVLFLAVLLVTTAAGVAIPLLFYGHVRAEASGGTEMWKRLLYPAFVERFNTGFTYVTVLLLVAAAGLLLFWGIFRTLLSLYRQFRPEPPGRPATGRWHTLGVVVLFGLLLAALAGEVSLFVRLFLASPGKPIAGVLAQGVSWPLLVIASAFIRSLLIQYVGDVAAYITPHTLDRFNELRENIKNCVQKAAHAVYALRENGAGYSKVIMVGHSLGSVIVYDTLNRLINEDELTGGPLNVAGRTPLLLTFGSPLDKTAFLFAQQGGKTSEVREALSASVQPLIQDYRFRPKRWINIYSQWDIISGALNFYDPPESAGGTTDKAVRNEFDPDATTILAAHTEYWSNPLLFRRIYEEVIR